MNNIEKFLILQESNVCLMKSLENIKSNSRGANAIVIPFYNFQKSLDSQSQTLKLDTQHWKMIELAFEMTKSKVDSIFKKKFNTLQCVTDQAKYLGYFVINNDHTQFLSLSYPCSVLEYGGQNFKNGAEIYDKYVQGNFFDSSTMLNVLRAKFGQNPELKTLLLATGSSFIAATRDQLFENAGNNVGMCLMQLRGEYGGTGVVAAPFEQSFQKPIYSYQGVISSYTNNNNNNQIQHPNNDIYCSRNDIKEKIKSHLNHSDVLFIKKLCSEKTFIYFYDDKTNPVTGVFGNFRLCDFEYGGKRWCCSEAPFQAEKFTDNSGVLKQFTQATQGDTAVSIARQNKMSPNRLQEWDHGSNQSNSEPLKKSVMRNVLRAKFYQNPLFMALLLATGDRYLVEHLPDRNRKDTYWSDGFDGSGSNWLGILLMQLRGELGGRGIVDNKPQEYLDSLKVWTQQNPSNSSSNNCIQCGTKPKFPQFDFCSQICGQLWNQKQPILLQQSPLRPLGASKSGDVCLRQSKGCQRQVYVEYYPNSHNVKKVHDYCGKTCSNLGWNG